MSIYKDNKYKLNNIIYFFIIPLILLFSFELWINNSVELFKILNTNNNAYTKLLANKITIYPTALLPLVYFIIVQLLIHSLFILYCYLLFINLRKFLINNLQIINNKTNKFIINYLLFILILILNYIFILAINSAFYPNSKFYFSFLEKKYLFLISVIFLYLSLTLILYKFIKKFISSKIILLIFLILSLSFILWLNFTTPKTIFNTNNNLIKYKKYNNISQNNNIKNNKPNIILITIDSFRADYINKIFKINNQYFDISSFIDNSVLFTNAYTPLARSFPALYSILSGKHPKQENIRFNLSNQDNINFDKLLPSVLKQHGYNTFYSTDANQFHIINKSWGYDILAVPKQGVYEQILPSINDLPISNLIINKYISNFLFPYTYANASAKNTYSPSSYINKINNNLSKVNFNKPVFLHFNFEGAHWPYQNKDTNKNLYVQDKYLSSLNIVNLQINNLFKILHKYNKNILNNTIVILASDHGEALSISNDRIINKNNYTGNKQYLDLVNKLPINYTSAEARKLRNKNINNKNYSLLDDILAINTSGGHGIDVLSSSQYKVVLAMQYFKNNDYIFTPKKIDNLVILNDIYPTVLSMSNIKPALNTGNTEYKLRSNNLNIHQDLSPLLINDKDDKDHKQYTENYNRTIFLETGLEVPYFKPEELEDKNTLQKFIAAWSNYYYINNNLYLELKPSSINKLVNTKQYAAVNNNKNILAYIPNGIKQNWEVLLDNLNNIDNIDKINKKCLVSRNIKDSSNQLIAILCNKYKYSNGYYVYYNYENNNWQIFPNDNLLIANINKNINKDLSSLYNKLKTYYNNEIKKLT